jgi:hypothetical protein
MYSKYAAKMSGIPMPNVPGKITYRFLRAGFFKCYKFLFAKSMVREEIVYNLFK